MATRTTSCGHGQLALAYVGPDPARISLCQCYECQKRTGSVFSVQARLPIENVTVEGQSKTWTFPNDSGEPATFRSCDSGGATYHFCPDCGSTVYWEIAIAPDVMGVAAGTFADPTFPTPMIAGFAAYGAAWAMNVSDLPMPHYDYVARRSAGVTTMDRPDLWVDPFQLSGRCRRLSRVLGGRGARGVVGSGAIPRR